jgi:hypothetical protein
LFVGWALRCGAVEFIAYLSAALYICTTTRSVPLVATNTPLSANSWSRFTPRAMALAWAMYERLGFRRAEELDFMQGELAVFGFRLGH